MKKYSVIAVFFLTFFFCSGQMVSGQEEEVGVADEPWEHLDARVADSATIVLADNILFADSLAPRPAFTPDPEKATWYALVCPGLGQIYNRSYWKVPILYGGIATFSYLIIWNGRMYNDYRNAYHDLMDNDPFTNSYEPIFANMSADWSRMESTLKRKRDYYRRNRDMAIFGMAALYLVSVVDAFVDAQLYNFSVSEDLSFQVEPVINNFFLKDAPGSNMLGLKCTINF